MSEFDVAFEEVSRLVEKFGSNKSYYMSAKYQEAEARLDFIDKFWIALGWDVNHDIQTNPYEQEVKVEKGVTTGGGQRRADYAFYLAPNFHDVRFFVEAKKPSVDIATNENCFQLIRYGWNSGTPAAVLMDFEQLLILDCRYRPHVDTALSRTHAKYHYTEYTDREKFQKIYWWFSHEAVADGSIEKRAKEELKKPRGRAIQRGFFPGGYQSIDEHFLAELDEHRTTLAKTFKRQNPDLDSETLTELAQRTLDRLIFLRFLEDKGIEAQRLVEHFGEKGTAWEDFIAASRRLNGIYNGIVYRRHGILDDPMFRVDDTAFADICESLAQINSPYDFNAIPIHILGSIYERYLGKVIVATAKRARVEEKPEVRKAGGVYYTPEYIVRYIVENTVGKLIAGKTPAQIAKMRFADIACGSGSFLLGVYDLLLKYHGQYYNKKPRSARKGDCIERDGKLYLSLAKKREILLKNIYGVDIDTQAVEVCQLSLYLKLLEDETEASAKQYLLDFEHTAKMKQLLPDLRKNIVSGNSLIGWDIDNDLFGNGEVKKLNPMDFEDTFPEVMKRGGFDAVVGNPPYRMLQPHNTSKEILAYYRIHYAAAEFKIDLFHMFLQRATSLLKDGGYLSYIVPTTILNNVYAARLRGWLMDRCCVEQIAVARGRVFVDADVHTSVLVFHREPSQTRREDHAVVTTFRLSPEFAARPVFRSQTCQTTFAGLPGRVWNILVNDKNASLISRLTTDFAPLEKTAVINRGLITGNRDKYFAKKKLSKQHIPILAGRDVHRYHTADSSEFVLFKRPESAGGCWDKEVHFAPHKLVVRQICEEPTASILQMPMAVTGNIFTIRADSLVTEVYLLGIINSRLIGFFWRTMFADFKTSFPQVTIFSLAQLPIRTINFSDPADKKRHDEMVAKVKMMLKAKKQLAKARTDKDKSYYENKCTALDGQIDRLVYDLYDLTEDEIAIVEGTTE